MSLSPRNLWEKSQELEDKGTNVSERIALKDSGNVGSDGEGTDGWLKNESALPRKKRSPDNVAGVYKQKIIS